MGRGLLSGHGIDSGLGSGGLEVGYDEGLGVYVFDEDDEISAGFGMGYSVGVPGDLGPYVRDGLRRAARTVSDGLLVRGGRGPVLRALEDGIGGLEAAEVAAKAILRASEGMFNPRAWFVDRGYSSEALVDYLGLSHLARFDGRFRWGSLGWEFHESAGARSRAEGVSREADEVALRLAGRLAGETLRLESWEDHREMLLAFRYFTVEQAAMLMPEASLWSVEEALDGWVRDGLVVPYRPRAAQGGGRWSEGVSGMDVFRVTKWAIREAVRDGLMSDDEAVARAYLRSGQAHHDLALNDALLVASLELAESGVQLSEVWTERAFAVKGLPKPWPDFRIEGFQVEEELTGREVQVPIKLDVEVVGVGGRYRTSQKRQETRGYGGRWFVPGFDGRGVRYGL